MSPPPAANRWQESFGERSPEERAGVAAAAAKAEVWLKLKGILEETLGKEEPERGGSEMGAWEPASGLLLAPVQRRHSRPRALPGGQPGPRDGQPQGAGSLPPTTPEVPT